MYLKRTKEVVSQQYRADNKYVLYYEVWVYAQFADAANPAADPYATVVNPILDALDRALDPTPESYQFLGLPQVANARIAGPVDICDGSLDGQVVIALTIEVYIGT